MINWKIRFKKKSFLVALFAAVLLMVQTVAGLFGYNISDEFGAELTETFNTVLTVLVLLGVISDPTTKGIGDSEQAKTYTEPK